MKNNGRELVLFGMLLFVIHGINMIENTKTKMEECGCKIVTYDSGEPIFACPGYENVLRMQDWSGCRQLESEK